MGTLLSAIPSRIAAAPATCGRPTGSPNITAPASAPTTGSRFTNAPAISAETRACPYANRVNGANVPATESPRTMSTTPPLLGAAGTPSVRAAMGTTATAAARNWAAVTATGSRPGSSRACATVNDAEQSSDASTKPSPRTVAPPPSPAATTPTPANDTRNPSHAAGGAGARIAIAEMTATITGMAPTSTAAWLTLVRATPAFWMRIVAP
jgi:hypothetical protein